MFKKVRFSKQHEPVLLEQASASSALLRTAGNETWTGSVNKILTSVRGGENSQRWLGNHGLSIPHICHGKAGFTKVLGYLS